MARICLLLSIVISVFLSVASSDVTEKMFNMLVDKTTSDVTLLRNDVNAMMSRIAILNRTLNVLLETMKVNSDHNGHTVEGIESLDKTDGTNYTKYVKEQCQTQIRVFETSMIVKQQDVGTQIAALQQIMDFNNNKITEQLSAVEETVSSNKQEIMSKLTALKQTVNSNKMTLEHWKYSIAYEVAIRKDPCVSSPCTNDGVCVSSPCTNDGLCVSNTGSYTCTCTAGWTETNCGEDVNECVSDPCENGATCINGQNNYMCNCAAGWTGTTCNTDVNECASNPCENGATCINGQNNYTCNCSAGWNGTTCTTVSSTDCYDVLHLGAGNISGVYTVRMPQSHDLVNVYCDMTTDGGGWTVFQYRFDGSVEFNEIFARYETGFGDVRGEFWLGLKFIHEMTHQTKSEIYLNFEDSNGTIAMERFSDFYISAGGNYTLHIGELLQMNYTTDSYNNLMYNNGQRFSAKDMDQDNWSTEHCAQLHHGGFWYKSCTTINPNGEYVTPGQESSYDRGNGGMNNSVWRGYESLKSTKLMFRRI